MFRFERGQAGILLILIMSIVGVISVAVASRTVDTLRSQEVDNTKIQAFKAAEAGLELALRSKTDVSGGLSDNISYSATYDSSGSDGVVIPSLEDGDVSQISVANAVGLTGVNLYWNGNNAVRVMIVAGSPATATYAVRYLYYDPDTSRALTNKFTAVTPGSYTFKSSSFTNRATIDLTAISNPNMIRVTLMYGTSSIAYEPLPNGSTLPDGQKVTITSQGTVDSVYKSQVTVDRFADKLPIIFDNVLYTKGALTQ